MKLTNKNIENARAYLKELQEARMKYGTHDFGKYLQECNKIDEKYGYNRNIYYDNEKDPL